MASISSSAVAFREAEVVDELLGVPARGQARDGDEAAFLRRQLRSLPDLTEQDVIREAHERRCKVPEHPLGTRRFVVVCHCCSPLVCQSGDEPQRRGPRVRAHHRFDIPAPVPGVLGVIGLVDGSILDVVRFLEGDVALDFPGTDPSLATVQRVAEPAATAPR